jgi:pimeloyl-ACP methyl ester carboxylesterase
MLSAETIHPEGGRYSASLVLVPGLWVAADAWRRAAGYLAHRGWESHLVDLRGCGGVAARGAAVAAFAAELPVPPILIGHDAGALVAVEAAGQRAPAAAVLLAPLDPARVSARTLGLSVGGVVAVMLGRRVQLAADLTPEDPALLRDLLWRRWTPPCVHAPTLSVVSGEAARRPPVLGAEQQAVAGAGRSLLAAATWQATADLVHRWLVRRLGAPLLELYPEAMAEREDEE